MTTLERLGFIASEYFPIDTQKAPVSVKYVCGVNPSCPAMTSCVMSEQEFNTEMGLIRKGIPFSERISDQPLFLVTNILGSTLWVSAPVQPALDRE